MILPALPFILHFMERRLQDSPEPSMITEAQGLIDLYPRELLPDWVAILAAGNPHHFESVREVALADIAAEVADDQC